MATSQLDLEALEAEIGRFLGGVAVAEGTGAKLQRLLRGFLERELLPQADRAAGMGLDPSPFLGVVSDILRRYADSLEPPGPRLLSSSPTGDGRASGAGHPGRDGTGTAGGRWRGVRRMGTARYAFRIRGRASDEALAALQEELEVEVEDDPEVTSTAIRGWLPDQAALYGILTRIRLLGLELLEVRRLPGPG